MTPSSPKRRGRAPRYPWRSMAVGDTFLAPPEVSNTAKFGGRVAQAREQTGLGFRTRCIEHEGQRRVQVERTR